MSLDLLLLFSTPTRITHREYSTSEWPEVLRKAEAASRPGVKHVQIWLRTKDSDGKHTGDEVILFEWMR